MATPSGFRSSEPMPVPKASGMPLSSAAMVVIMIGRKRSSERLVDRFGGVLPSLRSASRAKSTIMMPFFFTMPMSRMMPMMATISRSRWNSSRASSAPTPADGSVERMVIG